MRTLIRALALSLVASTAHTADVVRQRQLDDVGERFVLFVRPCAERAAKSVNALPSEESGARQQREQRVLAQRPACAVAGEQQGAVVGSGADFLRPLEHRLRLRG